MKKALALMLALAFCAACFVLTTGAVEDELSFLPQQNSANTATGCDYVINADGSVTVTLTATSATLEVVFNDGSALVDNKINMKENGKVVAVSYDATGSATLGAGTITKYTRKDKPTTDDKAADLYLNSLAIDTNYANYRTTVSDTACAWDLRAYLTDKGTYMPDDGIIEIVKTTFMFSGAVGDTITIYKYGIYADIPEDLGKESEAPSDESSEPADVSSAAESETASEAESEAASVAESEAASSAAASSAAESSKTPVTGDAGVAAIVVLAVVAAAGAAVIIRKRG